MQVIEKALGGPPPELEFFHTTTVTIAGKTAGALRHGMVGQPGWELFGPWDDGEAVREALVTAGEEFGLRLAGGRAYSSNTLESGWIPSPLPAVYSGESMKAYREWLPATGYEGSASIGGSFVSDDIEDYYFTPWDLGYGSYVKFDHDFVGREALEEMADGDHRQKVTLALDDDDVTRTIGTMFRKGERAKFMDWPSAVYSMHQFDRVTVDGETVGVSTWIGYSANEGKMLTLAVLDAEHAEPGTDVTLVWGEEDGGTGEAHRRAARAGRDRRCRLPGALRRGGTHVVRTRRLARVARLSPGSQSFEDVDSSGREVRVRPLVADDLESADRVMRLAFGTFHGLPDPAAAFGDRDYVRTRYRAAPDCAWAAEVDGNVIGSVFAARWGSFGFLGPLTVHPEVWGRGIASRLLQPVLEAFSGGE